MALQQALTTDQSTLFGGGSGGGLTTTTKGSLPILIGIDGPTPTPVPSPTSDAGFQVCEGCIITERVPSSPPGTATPADSDGRNPSNDFGKRLAEKVAGGSGVSPSTEPVLMAAPVNRAPLLAAGIVAAVLVFRPWRWL